MVARDLDIAILKTMAYFDLMDYPLVSTEIWRYLFAPGGKTVTLAAVEQALERHQPWRTKSGGFYLLADRPTNLIMRRQQRWRDSEAKWRRARRVARWLALLPFVRLIAVANTVSYHAATPASDIDLFVVTAPGRMWTARAACLVLLSMAGLRPGQWGRHADQVCLSFFIDTEHLNLEPTALPRTDIHFYYWVDQLYPIYDAVDVGREFFQANNWVAKYLPQRRYEPPHPRWAVVPTRLAQWIKQFGEWLTGSVKFEQWCQRRSLARLPEILQTKMNNDVGVIVQAGIIKLISNDRREGYRNEWVMKVNDLVRRYYG